MPDYSKLTVFKLREELQRRGLPKTGLKPILVQRLREADAQLQELGSTKDVEAVEPSILKSKKAAVNEPPPPAQAKASGGVGDGEAHINRSDGEERQPSKTSKTEPRVTTDLVTEHVVSSNIQPAKEADPPEPEEKNKEPSAHPVDNASYMMEKEVAQEIPVETLVDSALRTSDGIFEESSAIEGASVDASGAIPHSPENTVQEQASMHIIPTEPLSDEVNNLSANANSDEVQQLDNVDVTEKKEGGSLVLSTEENLLLPNEGETTQSTQLSEEALIEENSSLTKNTQLTKTTQASAGVTTSEVLEESRKRKRRSQSPVTSSMEIAQKRKKVEGSRSDVKLPEDVTGEAQAAEASTSEDIITVVPEDVMEELKVVEANTSEDTTMVDATSAQSQIAVTSSLNKTNKNKNR